MEAMGSTVAKIKLGWQSLETVADEGKAKPVGKVCKKEGTGKDLVSYYTAFELDGLEYHLEDTVLVTPNAEGNCLRPYVGIIKKMKQTTNGYVTLLFQWLYRPEEAEKSSGGYHTSSEARELFYSYHFDEVAAEAVMHRCLVHYIPQGKQFPQQCKYPGHVVRYIYDITGKRLRELRDKDFRDAKHDRQKIEELLERTRLVLGDLPDEVQDSGISAPTTAAKRRRRLLVLAKTKSACPGADHTPANPLLKMHCILQSRNALIQGDTMRNRWLEKLLQAVKYLFRGISQEQDAETTENPGGKINLQEIEERSPTEHVGGEGVEFSWPDTAVAAVCALESCFHDALATDDVTRYNTKMRSLEFNLKNSARLARRLLLKELAPASVLQMSPPELKAGFTSAEQTAKELRRQPAEVKLQTINMLCPICSEREVRVKDLIILAGERGRYELECLACGNHWFASRDAMCNP